MRQSYLLLVANPHMANVPIAELVDDDPPSEKTIAAIAYVISPVTIPAAVGISISTVITSAKGSYRQSGCQSGLNAPASPTEKTATMETTPTEPTAMKASTAVETTPSSTAKASGICLTARQNHGACDSRCGKNRDAEPS